MSQSIISRLLVLMLVASSGSIASAGFSITVAPVSGVSFSPYMSTSTSGTTSLTGGTPFSNGITMNYSITDQPTLGKFTINNLTFLYIPPPSAAATFTVTISDNGMTFPTAGTVALGFANFQASGPGTAGTTFSNVTTFSGTGNNTVTFPNTVFPVATSSNIYFSGSSLFSTSTSPGTITTQFTITLQPGSTTLIGSGTDPQGNSYGTFGLGVPVAPVPATALLGLCGVPTLALLRRRMKK